MANTSGAVIAHSVQWLCCGLDDPEFDFWQEQDIFSLQNMQSSFRTWPARYSLNARSWGWPLSLRISGAIYPFLVCLDGTGVSLPLPLSLLKNAVGTLYYVGLNGWIIVNNGLEMVGKKFSWPYLRHHPTIWVDGQRTVGASPESNQILLNAIWKCCHLVLWA
jgi:hypothetical protein